VMAESFTKNVTNNLQLNAAPVEKQILLRVKFAELDRSRELQYGVNLLGLAGQTQLGGTTGQFSPGTLTGTSLVAPSGAISSSGNSNTTGSIGQSGSSSGGTSSSGS